MKGTYVQKGRKMYEYIIGQVVEMTPAYLVLENQGIGYQILCGNPYYYAGKIEEQIKIYLHQVVREDAHTLYGFKTKEEKSLFLRLISVSGIGPKSGLAIMANEDHTGLIQAIENSDVTYLTKFPGVGKKTAQQLILDLKGKLGELLPDYPESTQVLVAKTENPPLEEAMAALQALGYSEKEVKKVYKSLLASHPSATTDEYLRTGLRLIMKK